jgi:hypothetical protein
MERKPKSKIPTAFAKKLEASFEVINKTELFRFYYPLFKKNRPGKSSPICKVASNQLP